MKSRCPTGFERSQPYSVLQLWECRSQRQAQAERFLELWYAKAEGSGIKIVVNFVLPTTCLFQQNPAIHAFQILQGVACQGTRDTAPGSQFPPATCQKQAYSE